MEFLKNNQIDCDEFRDISRNYNNINININY